MACRKEIIKSELGQFCNFFYSSVQKPPGFCMWVADGRVGGGVGGGGGGGRRLQCVTLPTRLAKNQAALCRDDAGRLHSTRAKNALIAQYNVILI